MYSMNDYQVEAMSFRLDTADSLYAQYGLAGEVGELFSLLAKSRRDGKQLDFDMNLKKELGDILWMVAAVAEDHGYTLQDVAMSNIAKLASRAKRGVLNGSGDNR